MSYITIKNTLLFLIILLFLSYPLYAHEQYSASLKEYPMRFAVIGDRTGSPVPGIYEQVVREIERMRPDFVLSVGDMIEGYPNDTMEIKRRWHEYQEIVGHFTMPFYYAPGNNDIWNSASLELYTRYAGNPFYSFTRRGVHFVVLNNSMHYTVAEFPQEQITWFINDLEQNKDAVFTIVILHVPYWIETVARGQADTLHNIFCTYGVDAVFTGHYHAYFSGNYDGVMYTGVGSSGGGCSPGPTGMQYHFVWVTIDKNGISIAPIKMDAVLPWNEVTADDFHFVDRIRAEAISMGSAPATADLNVPRTEIAVTIRNLNEYMTIEDTIAWNVPSGWSVTPLHLPINIACREVYVGRFHVQSSGNLYPKPTLIVHYPYAEGKSFELNTPLRISRTVYAHEATTPVLIDGQLNEKIWKQPTTRLFAPDGSKMSIDPVNFYFAWDENNLYLAAKCMEKEMDALAASATEHDGAVYSEDCVGYFLQPERADGLAYQIYFNPLGTAFDQKIIVEGNRAVDADREWNGTYEVKTSKGKDYWSIEVKIPLEQFETRGASDKTWAINFRRKQSRLHSTADWQIPISYNPEDYGILVMK